MSCLPKPVLRGHGVKSGIRAIFGSFGLGAVVSSIYYFYVLLPRKKAHQNFMKTYDPIQHYNDLAAWGYLQSAKEIKKKESNNNGF